MKILFKQFLGIFFFLFLISNSLQAQYSSKKVKPKFEAYTDSLKQVEYNYIFPILGQGAYKKGFDIPYPAGIMANGIWMNQDLVFSNFKLGFENENNDIPLTPVDFIGFGKNENDSQSYNIRPDIWILPFLNVYGLFGYGSSNTSVEVKLGQELGFTSIVDQEFFTKGVGVMAAGGVGPVWFSVDANWTWNKPQLLDKPVRVGVLGIRFGHTLVFKNKPQSNIAVWVGGMRAKMSSETSGQITLKEALPQEVWDRKDEFVGGYYDWYDTLSRPEQIAADKVLTPIVEGIDNSNGEGIVKYSMDKQTKQLWNGIVGAQYQINKHFMLRTEGGVIGNRKSFLLSFNYRFLL